jgi:hypothetical protein
VLPSIRLLIGTGLLSFLSYASCHVSAEQIISPPDPRLASKEDWERFEQPWRDHDRELERRISRDRDEARKVEADLSRIRDFENQMNDVSKDSMELSLDAIKVVGERLTGSEAKAYADALKAVSDWDKAYGAAMDAAGENLEEGEKAQQLENLKKAISTAEKNLALSKKYQAMHKHQQTLLKAGVNPSSADIFARVSGAYQRVFNIAEKRVADRAAAEKARREKEERDRSSDIDDLPRGPRTDSPKADGPKADGPRRDGPRRDGPRDRPDPPRGDGPKTSPGLP